MGEEETKTRRPDIAAMLSVLDALEPLSSDEERLRVIGAVALVFGHDEEAREVLRRLEARRCG